jgi:hypothetical protein
VGTWSLRGENSGDSKYPPSADFGTNECFTVIQLRPTLDTAQTWTLKDDGTVTVAGGGGNLDGKLTINLYVNAINCTGVTPITVQKDLFATDTGTGTTLTDTDGTSPITITVPGSATTYSLQVNYVSNNAAHKNITGTCNNENSTLSFTNGSQEQAPQ